MTITVIPVRIDGDIRSSDDLCSMIIRSLETNGVSLENGDILVVAQKAVSKAEGRIVDLAKINPSRKAAKLGKKLRKDPRIVELIINEAKEIVIVKNGIIITETKHGFICANSGVDQSNLSQADSAVLLPVNPDASARKLRDCITKRRNKDIAVVITDTFGRPFREGQTNVAVGVSGIKPIKNYIGREDMFGKKLRVTEIAVVDEIASAAELVMGKSEGVPLALVRGYTYDRCKKASSKQLVRPKKTDLFRSSRR
jgi:coenzyme F420-0:L-glutamate ligase / coenzyme F420-1:gamma-L-glutamate ligase